MKTHKVSPSAVSPKVTSLKRLLRSRLAITILSLLGASVAPQALAQAACGSPLTIADSQWTMLGIPCLPASNANTVAALFNSSGSFAEIDYNSTWVVWRRLYGVTNIAQCDGPSAALPDCYQKLSTTDVLEVGEALWFYNATGADVAFEFPNSATETSVAELVRPTQGGNGRFYMFANPYNEPFETADMLFRATFFIFPRTYTAQTAINLGGLSPVINYWNGNTYFTRALTNPTDSVLQPKQSAWFELLGPSTTVSNLRLVLPNPNP